MRGHARVDFGNLEQFRAAAGVAFPRGQFRRVLRKAAGVDHHAFRGFDDGFVKVYLVKVFGIGVVERFQMFAGLALDVEHPLVHEDDVIPRVGVAAAVDGVVGAVCASVHAIVGEI